MANTHKCCHQMEFGFSWRDGHQILTVTCPEHKYEQSIELEKIGWILGEPWLDAEEEESIRYAPGGLRMVH